MEIRTKPRLSQYVRRHHPIEQIIGDKEARPMTRNRLRSEAYLLSKVEPKMVNDALQNDESIKRLEEYISFVYFYKGMSIEEEVANPIVNQQQVSVFVESQPVNVKLHSDAKLQNEGNAHFDSEISARERDVELIDRNVQSDFDAERPNMETRKKPRLSKYVRRHHPKEKIIGDKEVRPMTRNRLRSETCLLRKIDPKTVIDAL